MEDLKTPKNHYEINSPVKGNENVNHDYSSDNVEFSNTDGSHSILRLSMHSMAIANLNEDLGDKYHRSIKAHS